MYNLTVNGRALTGIPGQTILQVCRENGIDIPTLCHDELTATYGACGLCVVEIEGNNKLLKACATEIADGMAVRTDTPRVLDSRKTNLELLLSNHIGDCRAPCAVNCPAGTDCQGYVGLIANGEFESAIRLIKEKVPLPAALGRVCPHPCEDNCRRKLVEDPVSIKNLKRFAADLDIAAESSYMPAVKPSTGKRVAVIGGGPYGLSIAYFLRREGHEITIYDAMPKAGGMLRYGIPEYRLPKALLDREIELIEKLGVKIIANTKIGTDISFAKIRADYDAVCLGIGAWISTGTGAKGEDIPGVIGGIDFLRSVVRGESVNIGNRVAVVGGGNTAMDACRTAVRLGASEVSIIYRRTKDEMPADAEEIFEAEEEGVIFKTLTNPIEYIAGSNGKVNSIHLQVMELGVPDVSGRRAPVPVEGKTETITVDTVILATGQAVNPNGFEELELTRKKGIVYDGVTFRTSLPGVFAGGDCGNDKISIAVEAVADAEKSAKLVDAYLRGEEIGYQNSYVHERDDVTEKTFEDRERQCRVGERVMPPEERKDNFSEIRADAFTAEEATKEASRCLECGCGEVYSCKLLKYSRDYDVNPVRFSGEKNKSEFKDDNEYIIRDPNKCIMCGLCVRVCDEVVGAAALGFAGRGFDATVKPAFERPLSESGCVSCGMCVALCPTGALQERLNIKKAVPLETNVTKSTCSHCSIGCSIEIETHVDMILRIMPDCNGAVNHGLLCKRGRFDFVQPNPQNIDLDSLSKEIAAKLNSDTAIAVSPRLTNEEMFAIKAIADKCGATLFSFDNRPSGLKNILGTNTSPNGIDDLLSTDLIIAVGFNAYQSAIVELTLRRAAKQGVRVVLVNPVEGYKDFNYAEVIRADNIESTLSGTPLYEEYSSAKNAMLVYQQNEISIESEEFLIRLAQNSGHLGSEGNGILRILPYSNSQGLLNLGITADAEALDGAKSLLIFGEMPDTLPNNLEFAAVCGSIEDGTPDAAIPCSAYGSDDGTYTNTEGRVQTVRNAVCSGLPTFEQAANAISSAL